MQRVQGRLVRPLECPDPLPCPSRRWHCRVQTITPDARVDVEASNGRQGAATRMTHDLHLVFVRIGFCFFARLLPHVACFQLVGAGGEVGVAPKPLERRLVQAATQHSEPCILAMEDGAASRAAVRLEHVGSRCRHRCWNYRPCLLRTLWPGRSICAIGALATVALYCCRGRCTSAASLRVWCLCSRRLWKRALSQNEGWCCCPVLSLPPNQQTTPSCPFCNPICFQLTDCLSDIVSIGPT